MKKALSHYEITPKVFKSDTESLVKISSLGRQSAFDAEASYLIRLLPMDESLEPLDESSYESIVVKPVNNALQFRHSFRGEQEHYVRIFKLPEADRALVTLVVYSLKADLFSRRPYRGDFHVHSYHSDGAEAPDIVAANYRKKGFDFLAITDHHRWFPSDEAIKAYEDVPIDLKLFHGEEVHSPGNHIHIVNFGGSFSVNELFRNDMERYEREVAEIKENADVPEGVNAYEYAACQWCFDRIREAGGLGIFAHPHWIANVYHVPEKMTDLLFERKPFDAFELIGGHEFYSNNMQTAYYNEARAKGMVIPIVGSSDSHGTEDAAWFNWFSTIIFSSGLELDCIKDAVKGLYSVAVESYPGEGARIYGPYRLVKYARFLLNEYFPLHDLLCFEEGRLMKDYICGDKNAKVLLGLIKGRTDALITQSYGECINGDKE